MEWGRKGLNKMPIKGGRKMSYFNSFIAIPYREKLTLETEQTSEGEINWQLRQEITVLSVFKHTT